MIKKRKNFYLFLILSAVLLLGNIGCTTNQSQNAAYETDKTSDSLLYASGFTIEKTDSTTIVKVLDPWREGETMAIYYLVKDKKTAIPANGIKIKIPISKLASASVTHLEFIRLLDEMGSITGFCTPSLAYNTTLQDNFKVGKIIDLGDAYSINVEKTLLLQPDVVMMSSQNQTDANAQRISQANIPVVYNNEWMEKTPLGRAEWIKFVAAFYDKNEQADSIFAAIENSYNAIKIKVQSSTHKPSVLSGSNFRGTWYMPAGNSYMAHLYRDAGASYFYQTNKESGSLSLNLETVLKNFSDADFWLYSNQNTMQELISEDKKYELFEAVKNRNVYNFNKKLLPSSANDFWESGVARPDMVLADIASIIHPELFLNHELVYAEKLE